MLRRRLASLSGFGYSLKVTFERARGRAVGQEHDEALADPRRDDSAKNCPGEQQERWGMRLGMISIGPAIRLVSLLSLR
jgi:hypothetical protein